MTKSLIDATLKVIPESFKAVLNKQPGPDSVHTFYALVDVEVEIDWKVELVSAVPQGISEFDKLLRFDVRKPDGKHSDAMEIRSLRYDEKPAAADYTSATIDDGSETQTITVEIVV